MRKTFEAEEKIEFKRDAEFSTEWEPGRYNFADKETVGWHRVTSISGEWFYVPSRRLRKATSQEKRR